MIVSVILILLPDYLLTCIMEIEHMSGIAKCLLFDGIPKNDIPVILSSIEYTIIAKKKGEIIAHVGEKCINAYILIQGTVAGKLYSPSGQCVRVRTHHEGIILAVAFLFAKEKKYPVTLEALTEVKLLCINHNQFDKLISSNNLLMKNLIMIISNNVWFYSKRVRLLSFSLKERLCEYLLELRNTQNSVNIRIPLSRQQLAEFLGVQKNSIQRCLTELEKEGLIEFEGRNITILGDLETLKIN